MTNCKLRPKSCCSQVASSFFAYNESVINFIYKEINKMIKEHNQDQTTTKKTLAFSACRLSGVCQKTQHWPKKSKK